MNITKELVETFGGDWETTFPELLERKAKQLEDSINGIVMIEQRRRDTYQIEVIRARSASKDIIKQELQQIQPEIIKTLEEGSGRWD